MSISLFFGDAGAVEPSTRSVRDDLDDAHPAPVRQTRRVLRVVLLGLCALIAWAYIAQIDQITRASAQVIPASRTQVIQAAEAGVVTRLHIKEGQFVRQGSLLVTLEKERAAAAVDDVRAKAAALRITLKRLQAEVYGVPLEFDSDLLLYPDYIRNQRQLYQKRRTAIEEDVAAISNTLALTQEELRMYESLEATGDVSRAELLRLRRQVSDLKAQITNKRNKYFQDAQAEMTKAQEELNTTEEQLRDRTQSLEHTELVAPTDGFVNNIRLTTVGAVVRPGDVFLEIVPTDGDLVAEAKVSPSDIAFVQLGDPADVKLDAYDYSIFGTLKGEVAYISPDTLTEEGKQGKQSFFRVHVRIRGSQYRPDQASAIQIRPGLTATVDIKANQRSVLSYLTKPITKTLAQSMGER